MKKISREGGKIIPTTPTSKKIHVEQCLASDKNFDNEFYDDTEDLMAPVLSSNKNGKSSDPESSSAGTNSRIKSSTTSTSRCDTCAKSVPSKDSFRMMGCKHLYCRPCIADWIQLKDFRNNGEWILCPESSCSGKLDTEHRRQILASSVIDRLVNPIHDETRNPPEPESNSSSSSSVSTTSASYTSTTFICEMCDKPTPLRDSLDFQGCDHFYCHQCIVKFVSSKLKDNVTSIVCPEVGCRSRGVLEPEYCRPILPNCIFDSWINAIHDHNGQSSDADSFNSDDNFTCELCQKQVHLEDSFYVEGCNHFYCPQCIVNFILSKLADNVTYITCPGEDCSTGVLDPEHCRLILPNEVFDWWETALQSQNEQSSNPEIIDGTSNDPSSSNDTSTFICDICDESFPLEESLDINGCPHFYCHQCIVHFVSSKVLENVTSINCPVPGCWGVLDPEHCHPILPNEIYDRWGKALCENAIMGCESTTNYFYCPFANCSALLIGDQNDDINRSECPHCKNVVCAKCKAPWHSEFDCDEFQRLRDKGEEEMVRALAKKCKWRKCEKCKRYVEKDDGCSYIKCRCGHAFCYNCGIAKETNHHTRYCSNCEREQWATYR